MMNSFVFQLCDDQPNLDGHQLDLDGVQVAPIVPVLFNHSRQKTIGRVVRIWREKHRILGALEFASTPSGKLSQWETRHGRLTHVSPCCLYQPEDRNGSVIRRATISEVTLTKLRGEPKCVRNVLLQQPDRPMARPTLREAYEAELWTYDRAEMARWVSEQPVEVVGVQIDHRELQWDDPVLEPA